MKANLNYITYKVREGLKQGLIPCEEWSTMTIQGQRKSKTHTTFVYKFIDKKVSKQKSCFNNKQQKMEVLLCLE